MRKAFVRRRPPLGSTNPQFTSFILFVIVLLGALDWSYRRFGVGLHISTSLIGIGILVGIGFLAYLLVQLRFRCRRRMLEREFGIHYSEFAPPYLEERLKQAKLPDYGVSYQYCFYCREEGMLRIAVFQHGWETGFGDGRRSHETPALAVDLKDIPELSPKEILALFESQEDLDSCEADGLLVVYAKTPSANRAFLPERIIPAVCGLYQGRTA